MQQDRDCFRRAECRESGCCVDGMRRYVDTLGGRLTQERLLLLRAICDYEGHFTPEDLQQSLAKSGKRIATTTIYRNLPALLGAGIIKRTTLQEEQSRGAATYEHVWGRPHHDHLLCEACAQKVEFEYDAIEVLQQEVARQHGFLLRAHHMELIGLCPKCQGDQAASDAAGVRPAGDVALGKRAPMSAQRCVAHRGDNK